MSEDKPFTPESWVNKFLAERPTLDMITPERYPLVAPLLKTEAGKELRAAHDRFVAEEFNDTQRGVPEIAAIIKYDRFMYMSLLSLAVTAVNDLAKPIEQRNVMAPRREQEATANRHRILMQLAEDIPYNRTALHDNAMGHKLNALDVQLDVVRHSADMISQFIHAIKGPGASHAARVSRDGLSEFQDRYDQNLVPLQESLDYLRKNVENLQNNYQGANPATKEIWKLAQTFADHAASQMADLQSIPDHMITGWSR